MVADRTPTPRATLTLATYNVHMGVDGWGRPWDVVGECDALDADVIVMQESWTPDGDGLSTAGRVADALDYRVVDEVELARVRLGAPIATSSARWGPRPGQVNRTLQFDQLTGGRGQRPTHRDFVRGRWSLAVLARVPVRDESVLDLGKLRRDPAHRVAISCRTDLGGREVTLVGTHMSHITHGSHAQYRRLSAQLPHADTAAVLAGDMNLWGPPVNSYFPAWRHAFTGRTWPTRRPHSQLDHVLITPSLSVVDARVAPRSGSDHRPVVVTLALA